MRIRSLKTISTLKEILQRIDPDNVLMIFDIDEVLITPINNHSFWRPSPEQLLQKIKRQSLPKSMNFVDSVAISTTKYHLTDPEIINVFSYLKEFCIPTIALTAMGTGSFGVINNLEDLRISTLKEMGINFTEMNTFNGQILAKELEGNNVVFPISIGIPMLKDGIVFTAGVDKGTVLEYILSKKNYYPKTILFVDDNLSNIESLEKLCIKLQINFYGFHYIPSPSQSMLIEEQNPNKISLHVS